jgi:hypothetical protein
LSLTLPPTQSSVGPSPIGVIGPPKDPDPGEDHFNYDELDVNCSCSLCDAYRKAKIELEEASIAAEGLSWKGMCDESKRRRKAHIRMLAISNKRDLYCEMSFLTHGKRDGHEIMAWIQGKLKTRSAGWWANHSAKRTLGSWILEWSRERDLARAARR